MAFNRLSVLSLLASRSVIAYPSQNAQNQTIAWAPCPGLTEDILCGSLKVPLDYTNPTSSETLELKMVKVAAVKAPKKGSILFNPGGPGSGGRDMVADGKDGYHVISGGQYDLIGFDPRGTSDTLPINCFASEQEENLFKNDFQSLPNETDTALGVYVAGTIVRADACYENNKNTGDLLGTAFVARDMLQVVNALQEDGLLNFWGFSYGTALGSTFAAMFPDKVGKMVLDGVTNGHEYFSGRNKEWIVDTDGAVQGFLSSCIAAKSSCPLTNHGNSTSVLTSKILQKLEQLKQNPATVAGQQVTYAGTKSFIWQQSYHPYAWPVVAQSLDHFLNGKYEAFQAVQASLSKDESPFPKTSNDALSAISCGDYAWRTADFEEIKQYANEMEAKSIFGGLTGLPQEIDCAAWRFQAKERYQGDFHVQTRNPILFVGNTHDPVTPYASAKNMSTGFDGSVLLHHDGYGHCSNAQPSICTANNIRAYWQDGSLPSEGTYCEPEYPPFVSTQNQDEIVVPALSSRALKPRSEDDKALLEAVETLGRLQSKTHRSQWKV